MDLIQAAKEGDVRGIYRWLAIEDKNFQDKDGETALCKAAFYGHRKVMNVLIRAGADLNLCNKNGDAALHMAAEQNQVEMVTILVAAGADLDLRNKRGVSSLHLSAHKNHSQIVNALLLAGADVNMQDWNGFAALHGAAREGHQEAVNVLLQGWADVNMQSKRGATALNCAAEMGHLEVMNALLQAGADVNLQSDFDGRTALHYAARSNQLEIVFALLDDLTDKNLQNNDGKTALHEAAGLDHLEVVNALLQAGADMHLEDKSGWTVFYQAAHCGRIEVVNVLLRTGADVNRQVINGDTALHSAAERGRLDLVIALVQAGADVNLQNCDGWTPFHKATYSGCQEVINVIVEAGADVNMRNKNGDTALHSAAEQGRLEMVSALVQAGADVNVFDERGFTALHNAADRGRAKVVIGLLQAGADVNLQMQDARTALYIAAYKGHMEVVNALLQAGANVNLQDERGLTALSNAANGGNLEVVHALLQAGADVNLQSKWGPTALQRAASEGHLEIMDSLLQADADINLKNDCDGDTALHYAASNGQLEPIHMLLKNFADINLQSNNGCTALYQAANLGYLDVVNVLMQAGADVNIKDKLGWTALHKAVERNYLDVVNALVQAGADLNQQTNYGETALHAAAEGGHLKVANALLLAGANVHLQTDDGDTALHKAAEDGHPEVLNALLQAGADVNHQNNGGETALDLARTDEIKDKIRQHIAAASEAGEVVPHSIPPIPMGHSPPPPVRATVPFSVASTEGVGDDEPDPVRVVLAQAAGVQARREWKQRRDALQAQYDAAEAAEEFEVLADVGAALADLEAESNRLALSLEDFDTLASRCKQLCKELLQVKDFKSLKAVSEVLSQIKDGSPTTPHSPSVPSKDDNTLRKAISFQFTCGDAPIEVSGSLGTHSARTMLRGHFSNVVTNSSRKSKTVTQVPCVIKCAVGSAADEPLKASVAALRYEHSIYELIRKRAAACSNGITGCVHCYSAHPSYDYLVLEDHGQDLTHLLNPHLENGQQVVRAIVEAVQALHSLSVMHGDIKPQNLLYRYNCWGKCEVKVCDLDTAHQVGEECVASTLGTKYFHAPEVYRAAVQSSHMKIKAALVVDLFALGLVLWQVLQRSPLPALSHAAESQLDRCYADQATLLEHVPAPARGQWSHQYLQSLTSLEPHKRMSASALLKNIQMLDASSAQQGWLQEQQRNEHLQHSVVDGVTQLKQGQESLSEKVDTANAKLDRVLVVLQRKFDVLGQEVVGVAATLRKEMLLGREQGHVLEGMVQATQDFVQQLSVKAPGDSSCVEGCINGDQIVSLLSTLQSRIEERVTSAVFQQMQQQPSSPSQDALRKMSAQFKAQFSTLCADLQVFMEDQRCAQATSSTTLQDQQKQAQQMQQCLTSSLQDVLSGLSAIKREVAQLRQDQEQLGRQVAEVLTHNKELAAMVNTLITGTHSIPTLAIILPVVSTSWRSLLLPLRLMRNKFRLYFLCSRTHRIAPCGPKGNGYKITVTKQWVQEAAPVLRVGLVLVKLALLSAGLPLPVPDLPALLSANGLHAKYLDAALHLVQHPADDKGGAEFDMDKAVDKLVSWEERHLLQEQGMGEGGMALQEGSRKAYETIQEVLRKDGVNIALTSGLRQVTHGGKTAWVLDSDEVEEQLKGSK